MILISVEDIAWMNATFQTIILQSKTAKDIRQDLIVNAILLEIFKFARQIDDLIGKLTDDKRSG